MDGAKLEKEGDKFATTEDFSVVRQEGKCEVRRSIKHYNCANVCLFLYRNSKKQTG